MTKKLSRLFGTILLYATTMQSVHSSDFSAQTVLRKMQKYHQDIVVPNNGIGAREAGSENEAKALAYIAAQFKDMGYTVQQQSFPLPKSKKTSGNIIADSDPSLPFTVVVGAHVDSIGTKEGSLGASDNGSGLAVLLTIASQLATRAELPINLRFIAFGAEEIGKIGSFYYVKKPTGKRYPLK